MATNKIIREKSTYIPQVKEYSIDIPFSRKIVLNLHDTMLDFLL